MRRTCASAALAIFLAATISYAADPRLVDGVSGAPIAWSDWVAKRGPVAVLVWASWAPDAEDSLEAHGALAAACKEAGLHLVVLDVQETLDEGRSALYGAEFGWLHDRHGALLKQYRVIEVPSLLLVAADGRALGKIEASPEAIQRWSNR
jgi:hypothetical protein